MMTDPIADFLIRIKNSYLAGKDKVVVPHSKMKQALARLLLKEGYVNDVKIENRKKTKDLIIRLIYDDKIPKLTDVVRVSKPGRKVFVKRGEIPKVLGGLGIVILSTSSGVMTDKEARKKGIGGEMICKIW